MTNEFEGARMSLEAALIEAEQYRGEAGPAILADSAKKFRAEKWTTVCGSAGSHELWAVIMLDGDEANQVCAFGDKADMERYAEEWNSKVVEGGGRV